MVLHVFGMEFAFDLTPCLEEGDALAELTELTLSCRVLGGATAKVAAAVQVAGGATTVQVAGHCISGGEGATVKVAATVQRAQCRGSKVVTGFAWCFAI